ncbi:hypothetical protein HS088_TW04G00313 [Tripterygium wilfordii]|uniref:DUF7880 domain-containing protein n=1 Tax=Tripterygium wilfordii TaxID=458696 RepID=A0A7J7DPS4_TRIWF|nr:uncharacterized protein LOC119996433 [Tripterygium wilfordii]KAF5748360.1 hypothetical protein HS088_TW04G00313 [Tripterygium wilfordii]
MDILGSTAQVSTRPFVSSPLQRCPSPISLAKGTKYAKVRCASYLPKWLESRRLVSISLVLSPLFLIPDNAIAGSFFDKYVKRKKLDPLEAYVPAIILTQIEIKDLEKTLELDQPQFATCRSLLRSGPFASFRVNIRAVAQYASDAGKGSTPNNDVDQCLRALEELDSLLLHASRNDPEASVNEMKAKIGVAVNALDSLLKTVPSDIFDKGRAAADAYRTLEEDTNPEILDPELKQLESIL